VFFIKRRAGRPPLRLPNRAEYGIVFGFQTKAPKGNFMKLSRLLPLLAAPLALLADTVTLDNGDRLTGTVTKIYDGVVTLETVYAGNIAIKQANVASMTLDAPVNVRAGEIIDKVEGGINVAALRVIDTLWPVGAADPDAPPSSSWNFSIAGEARYSDGNSHDTVAGLRAEANYLDPDVWSLLLFTGANYNKADGSVSDHKLFGGADANRFLSEHTGLYAREELLTDRANDIKIRSTFGAGGEYYFYKTADLEMLRLRAGLGHRHEKHRGADADSNSNMTVDFGARFHKRISDVAAWTTELTYAPAIDDFANYLVTHDSRCAFDLVKKWKLTYELGVANTYNSRPPADSVYLDSTYYTRVRKTW